ncbi:hypothetical protein BU23DRAFT_103380 [Bimuria novae-zelandiae CBS 107.79]|uniref:Uncharacterized protein n=1 Tax=Bimuria novae-zelandiae CBS 107.79 TaxID=1447943 RepID=A0A6A5VSJ2_9PLEO|nr:hypothetical protein BU23DRAFT_103380 [Bimuria novae-zelandiae CBS 107.79]
MSRPTRVRYYSATRVYCTRSLLTGSAFCVCIGFVMPFVYISLPIQPGDLLLSPYYLLLLPNSNAFCKKDAASAVFEASLLMKLPMYPHALLSTILSALAMTRSTTLNVQCHEWCASIPPSAGRSSSLSRR